MKPTVVKLFCICSLWALLVFSAVAATRSVPPDSEAHHYIERIGDTVRHINWCAVRSPGNTTRLFYRGKGEVHVTEADETLATRQWRLDMTENDTAVSATRDGETLLIQGSFRGSPIDKRLPIDDAPWFQASSLSLRRFVLSADTHIDYWAVREDTMTVHKLSAKKVTVEEIEIAGQKWQAQVIELRLNGPLSIFWSSRYWFRLEDGVFLKFSGPSGPPGDPIITISYEGEAELCDPPQ